MAAIGAVACTNVKGSLPLGNNARVRTFHRAGATGVGARIMGWGGNSGTVKAIFHADSLTSLLTWSANIQALVGYTVTVVTGDGVEYYYRLVTRVGPLSILPAVDSTTTVRGEHEVELYQT